MTAAPDSCFRVNHFSGSILWSYPCMHGLELCLPILCARNTHPSYSSPSEPTALKFAKVLLRKVYFIVLNLLNFKWLWRLKVFYLQSLHTREPRLYRVSPSLLVEMQQREPLAPDAVIHRHWGGGRAEPWSLCPMNTENCFRSEHTHTRVPHSKRLAIGALNVGEGPRAPAGGPEKNRAAMCKKAGKYDMFAVF